MTTTTTAPLTEPIPTRPDGSPYPYVLMTGSAATGSTSLLGLVAATMPDLVGADPAAYADLPDTDSGHDEATWRRYCHLVAVGAELQGGIAASDPDFDPRFVDEETLTAIFRPKDEPFAGDAWAGPVPLVLIRSDYAPLTDRALPAGDIVWLDPTTERTYLESLASAGVVDLLVAAGG